MDSLEQCDTVDRNSSIQIVPGVVQVATGSEHSVFLKSDGSLHTMGSNIFGQLGTGDNQDRNASVQILSSGVVQIAAGARHTLFLLKTTGAFGGLAGIQTATESVTHRTETHPQ